MSEGKSSGTPADDVMYTIHREGRRERRDRHNRVVHDQGRWASIWEPYRGCIVQPATAVRLADEWAKDLLEREEFADYVDLGWHLSDGTRTIDQSEVAADLQKVGKAVKTCYRGQDALHIIITAGPVIRD